MKILSLTLFFWNWIEYNSSKFFPVVILTFHLSAYLFLDHSIFRELEYIDNWASAYTSTII